MVRAAGIVLAQIFLWYPHVLYPTYVPLDRMAGVSPLSDQRLAGLIMFLEGGLVTVLVFCWLFLRMTREVEVRQRLIERNVDPATAARAARYDRAARVRDVTR